MRDFFFGGDAYALFSTGTVFAFLLLAVPVYLLFVLVEAYLARILKGVDFMRIRRNKRVDKEVFRRTAKPAKSVNLGVLNFRGGVRF